MRHQSKGGQGKIEIYYGISIPEMIILYLLCLQEEEEEADLETMIMISHLQKQQLVMIHRISIFMSTAFGTLEPWITYAGTAMPKPLKMNLKDFAAKKERLMMCHESQHHLKSFLPFFQMRTKEANSFWAIYANITRHSR